MKELYQLLMYSDDGKLLDESINAVKTNTGAFFLERRFI